MRPGGDGRNETLGDILYFSFYNCDQWVKLKFFDPKYLLLQVQSAPFSVGRVEGAAAGACSGNGLPGEQQQYMISRENLQNKIPSTATAVGAEGGGGKVRDPGKIL